MWYFVTPFNGPSLNVTYALVGRFFFFKDDDGFILYETRAICYYIAAKYPNQGTPLLPIELKANALFHQAASSEIYHFSDNILKAAEEMMLKPWVFRQDHLTRMSNG